MDLGLAGKRVLITGGTRGIGRATLECFFREGARVAFCARSDAGVRDALAALGGDVFAEALDVRDEVAFDGFITRAVAALGGLDIAISNVSTRPTRTGVAAWRESFEVDLNQHVLFADRTLPALRQGRDATLLFVSSIASGLTQLPPGEDAYGAMKAALISLTGQLAAKNGVKGVRVNAVSPGPILFDGGVWDTIQKENPQLFTGAARLAALGRHGRPEEVADVIAFLCSPRAGYITGANVRIDGGAVKSANF